MRSKRALVGRRTSHRVGGFCAGLAADATRQETAVPADTPRDRGERSATGRKSSAGAARKPYAKGWAGRAGETIPGIEIVTLGMS